MPRGHCWGLFHSLAPQPSDPRYKSNYIYSVLFPLLAQSGEGRDVPRWDSRDTLHSLLSRQTHCIHFLFFFWHNLRKEDTCIDRTVGIRPTASSAVRPAAPWDAASRARLRRRESLRHGQSSPASSAPNLVSHVTGPASVTASGHRFKIRPGPFSNTFCTPMELFHSTGPGPAVHNNSVRSPAQIPAEHVQQWFFAAPLDSMGVKWEALPWHFNQSQQTNLNKACGPLKGIK